MQFLKLKVLFLKFLWVLSPERKKKNLLFKWKGNVLNIFLFSFVDSFTIFVFFLWLMPLLSSTRSRTHPNHSAWTTLMDFFFFCWKLRFWWTE
jgi:hypothetical protein